MNILNYNKLAWDRNVEAGNEWTIPVSAELIALARKGVFEIVLTANKPVPADWFPPFVGARVLGLACGGGQQSSILAAAGAIVTVFDNSPKQLAQDQFVAAREGLEIATIEGDMADLSIFENETFDLIFHPVSNVFVPDVRPVWKECARVLKPGGVLLAGFMNPVYLALNLALEEQGTLELRYPLPYFDITSLSREDLDQRIASGEALEFGHTLEDQIGGQIDAGLMITGFYEADWKPARPISRIMNSFIATRAVKR
jgi:SAM-dependent methyltransferase